MFLDYLIHELCHAIVWDAQGRIGTNQWGLGPYFSTSGPGRTIEALVEVLHSFFLSTNGDEAGSRKVLREEFSGSTAAINHEDFIEAVRIWGDFQARLA
jgi:hypothetical protein